MRNQTKEGLNEVKQGLTAIDNVTSAVSANFKTKMAEQRTLIKQIEGDIKELEQAYAKLAPGKEKMQFGADLATAKKILVEEKGELTELEKKLKIYEQAQKDVAKAAREQEQAEKAKVKQQEQAGKARLKQQEQESKQLERQSTYMYQLRQLRQEMFALTNADGTVSPENLAKYDQLKAKIAEVGTSYRRVRQEQKMLTTEGSAQLAGVISGISGVAGAFTAAQGVSSLFVKDSEKLVAVQTRLQSVMAITIGLQQTASALSATSAFRINTARRVTDLWRSSVLTLEAAFIKTGIAARTAGIAAKALSGIGVGLLIAGISLLVSQYQKLRKEQIRLNDASKEYNKTTIVEQANINRLFDSLKKAKEGTKAYQKARDEIHSKYGSYLEGLSTEIQLLKDQEGAFKAISKAAIQAAKDKAIASGTEKSAEEYAKVWSSNMKKLREMFIDAGVENVDSVTQDINKAIEEGTIRIWLNKGPQISGVSDSVTKAYKKVIANSSWDAAGLTPFMGEIITARNKYTKEVYELNSIFGSSADDGNDLVSKNKKYWENVKSMAESARDSLDVTQIGSEKWKELTKTISDAEKEIEKYSSSSSNKTNASRYEMQRDADRKRIDQIQSAIDLELEIRANEIDLLDESSDKKLKAMQLNYDKEYNEVLKHQENMLRAQQDFEYNEWKKKNPNYQKLGMEFTPTTTNASQLPDDIKGQISGMFSLAYSKSEGAQKDLLKNLLKSYQDYQAQREELEENYNETVKALNAGRTEQNAKEIDRAIAEAGKRYRNGLSQISKLEIEESGIWKKLMGDISAYPTEVLKKLFDNAEKAINESTNLSVEDIKVMRETLDKTRRDLIQRNPFKTLKNEYEKYKAAVKSGDNAGASESWEKVTIASESIKDNISLLGGTLSQFGSVFSNQVSESIGKAVEMINQGITAFQMLGKKEGRTASETIQGVSSLIGIITTLFSSFASVLDSSAEKQVEHARQQASYWESINYQVERYIELLKEASGEDYFKIANDSVSKLKLGLEEARNEVLKFGGSTPTNTALDWLFNAHNKGIIDLNASKNILTETLYQKYGKAASELGLYKYADLAKEILNTIGDLSDESLLAAKENEEFWKRLPNSVQEAINKFIEYKDKINDLQEQLSQDLFQTTSSDITDIILQGLKDSEKGIEEFGEDFEEIMRNALLQSFVIDQLREKAQEFYRKYTSLADSDEDGKIDLTAIEIDELKKDWQELVEGAMEERDRINELIGAVNNKDTSQEASRKGFEAMSQETGTKLEGLFTSVQMHVSNIDDKITDITQIMYQVLDSMGELIDNTSYCRLLEQINERMERMERDGIKTM